jgi:hypothetical protein
LVGAGVHVPADAFRVWPVCAVPEIEGSGEIVKVDGGGVDGAACTTTVWPDVADVEPFLFVATTTIRKVEPASVPARLYDDAVTPRETHAPPEALQRCHEIENVAGGPAQLPAAADSCAPTTADPAIDGSAVFFGADCPGPAEDAATGSPARHRASSAVRWGERRRR